MFKKLKSVFSKFKKEATETKPEKEEPKQAVSKDIKTSTKPKKTGFFQRLSEKKATKLLGDLEEELIQNNVAYDISQKICSDLKESKDVKEQLKKSITDILTKSEQIDLIKLSKENQPLIILFVGVNGVGKTTTIAKLATWFQKKKKSVVFAAADTFRAASIEQLESHADKVGVRMIKHKYGSDPAAVAYDAIDHAKAKGVDVVIIDTAGRQHSSDDLMDELHKIKRVAKPHITILVVDSLTGNDAVDQAKMFNDKIGIDGSILTKTDTDERGGAIISVGYESGKPILFLGTGQTYDSLEVFDADKLVKQIL